LRDNTDRALAFCGGLVKNQDFLQILIWQEDNLQRKRREPSESEPKPAQQDADTLTVES
jgi:hypothetical protein